MCESESWPPRRRRAARNLARRSIGKHAVPLSLSLARVCENEDDRVYLLPAALAPLKRNSTRRATRNERRKQFVALANRSEAADAAFGRQRRRTLLMKIDGPVATGAAGGDATVALLLCRRRVFAPAAGARKRSRKNAAAAEKKTSRRLPASAASDSGALLFSAPLFFSFGGACTCRPSSPVSIRAGSFGTSFRRQFRASWPPPPCYQNKTVAHQTS